MSFRASIVSCGFHYIGECLPVSQYMIDAHCIIHFAGIIKLRLFFHTVFSISCMSISLCYMHNVFMLLKFIN